MSHEDDVTAPQDIDAGDDEFGTGDYDLEDDLDAGDDAAAWDEDDEEETASWSDSPAHLR
jgi:hypothetical protein